MLKSRPMSDAFLRRDVFLKSFFIQAAWNAERMQNIGFLFSIRKSLKRIWADDPQNFDAACARASSFFNTHPYFAPALMGVTLHMEEKIASGLKLPEEVDAAKARLSPPLNALGSLWFWDHLKLLAFLLALPFFTLRNPLAVVGGAILFFGFFNFHHLRTRWIGLDLGLRYGEDMIHDLICLFPNRLLPMFRRVSAFLLGASTPLVLAAFYGLFQNRLPVLLDVFYVPDLFPMRLFVSLCLVCVAMVIMYFRWLSVYQFIALAMGVVLGVTLWA